VDIHDSTAQYLEAAGVKKLYVRAFDIDWSEERNSYIPKAIMQWNSKNIKETEIVFSVFITHKTFEKIAAADIPHMAKNAIEKLISQAKSCAKEGYRIREIQWDCDWSPTTQKKYFTFLEETKKHLPPPFTQSATIRLHQFKYPKETGVPPVQKGMLMFYNMSDIKNPQTENSILDIAAGRKYLSSHKPYPIPLDVVLPVYDWGVIIRNGKVIDFIPEFSPNDSCFRKGENDWLSVTRSHYYNGIYLYEGDKIRQEGVSFAQLDSCTELLAPLLQGDSLTVSFFHLNPSTPHAFPAEKIQSIWRKFL
jgi:hypothetical protein